MRFSCYVVCRDIDVVGTEALVLTIILTLAFRLLKIELLLFNGIIINIIVTTTIITI